MPTIVCPYCFARMRSHKLEFRCLQSPSGTRSGQPCPSEPDEKLAAFLGRTTPVQMAPVFVADNTQPGGLPKLRCSDDKASMSGMPQRPARRL